ncbi:MAG: hypothetical protein VX171_06270 [Pseudomonadota bacterium]|nr:hypothetical protein [Pseudomonadota bacterium]
MSLSQRVFSLSNISKWKACQAIKSFGSLQTETIRRLFRFAVRGVLALFLMTGFGSKGSESEEFKKVKKDYESGVTKFIGDSPTFEIRDNAALQYKSRNGASDIEGTSQLKCAEHEKVVKKGGEPSTGDSRRISEIDNNDLVSESPASCSGGELRE